MSIRLRTAVLLAFALLHPRTGLAVTVHGLESSAAGSATLSVTGSATSGYALEVDNLGSSGQDGVSILLPHSRGLSLEYGTPSATGAPIVHRDLACRSTSGGFIQSLANLVEDRDLLGLRTHLDVPGAPPVTIEAWNGPDLVYSAVHAAGTEVTAAGISIDEPGVHVTMSFDSPAQNGLTAPSVRTTVTRQPTIITIEGRDFVADRYVLRAGCPLATTVECTEARLLCATEGSGGGGGAAGRVAIKSKGLPGPRNRSATNSMGAVSALSGVVLEFAAGNPEARLHVSKPAADPDPALLRLNGLPPGTPYIGDLSRHGLPPGEPYIGSLRLNGLPPGEPWIGTLRTHVLPNFLTDTPGQSVSLQAQVVVGSNGSPAYEYTEQATWSTSNPGRYVLDASANDADHQTTVELYRGPRQTVSMDGSFAHLSSSKPFRSHVVRCPDGSCRMSFGFGPGVLIMNNGAVQDADSIVLVSRVASGQHQVLGVIDEYVVLSQVPGLTIVSTDCAGSHAYEPTGLPLTATGNAALSPEYTERRWPVRNLGSSGEDGVAVECDAVRGVDVPFSSPVPLADFSKLEWRVSDCADGSCAPSARVRCFGAGQPHPQSCDVTLPNAGSNPVFVDAGDGQPFPYRDIDADGDGIFDITPVPGTAIAIAGAAFRRVLSASTIGNVHERFELRFATPVTIVRSGRPPIAVQTLRFLYAGATSTAVVDSGGHYKLFSVTGQPTPVGEASNDQYRGVGGFTIDGPSFDSSVQAAGDPGVVPVMAGHPVLETWSQPAGEIRVADLDRDGFPDLARTVTFIVGDEAPTTEARLVWSPRSNRAGAHVNGFGFEADYDAIPQWPDSLHVALEVTYHWQLEVRALRIEMQRSSSGTVPIDITLLDPTGDPAGITVEAYHGGVLQASAPYDPAAGVGSSSPAGILILEADLDGDGEMEPLCTNFAPGNVVVFGGGTYPCDQLVFRKIGGAIKQDDINSCVVRLNGLPPGEPILHARLAALDKPGAPLGVPRPAAAPRVFALSSAWPNPAAGAAALRLSLPTESRVRATVVDVGGRVVATLADRTFLAGEHVLEWNGRRAGGAAAAAGIYFVRVERGDGRDVRVARLTRLR